MKVKAQGKGISVSRIDIIICFYSLIYKRKPALGNELYFFEKVLTYLVYIKEAVN